MLKREKLELQVNVKLKGKDLELFKELRKLIENEYKNIPSYRLSNAKVLRIAINRFIDYYKAKIFFDMLVKYLKENHPEIIDEFIKYVKDRAEELIKTYDFIKSS